MSNLKRLRVGLPKPAKGKIKPIFYAPFDGTITPEVGSNPTTLGRDTKCVAGYYDKGIQLAGNMQFDIGQLDVTKDFTFTFTYTNPNIKPFSSGWFQVISLELKTYDGAYISNSIFNISLKPSNWGEDKPYLKFYHPSTALPKVKNKGNEFSFLKFDRSILEKVNVPVKITFAVKDNFMELYQDDILVSKIKIGEIDPKFLSKPELVLKINNTGSLVAFSEVLITQEYLPPANTNTDHNVEDIILPAKNYTNYMGQTEISNVKYKAVLPASFSNGSNNINGYGKGFKDGRTCLKSNPNICLYVRSSNDVWKSSDSIEVYGIFGEVLTSSPKVYYMNEDREVLVTGNWSGVGTEVATFTLGSNEGLNNQNIIIECTCALPKSIKSIIGRNAIEYVLGLNYAGKTFIPQNYNGNLESAPCIVIPISSAETKATEFKFVPETLTACLDGLDKPFDLLVYTSEVPVDLENTIAKTNNKLLAKSNPFISTVSFNKLMVQYNKLHKVLLSSQDTSDLDILGALFHSDGNPIVYQGSAREYNSTRFTPNIVSSANNEILTYGVDFGRVSDDSNLIKPIIVYPYLFKNSKGELKARLIVRKVASPTTSINNTNVGVLGYINIRLGIFEK